MGGALGPRGPEIGPRGPPRVPDGAEMDPNRARRLKMGLGDARWAPKWGPRGGREGLRRRQAEGPPKARRRTTKTAGKTFRAPVSRKRLK